MRHQHARSDRDRIVPLIGPSHRRWIVFALVAGTVSLPALGYLVEILVRQ